MTLVLHQLKWFIKEIFHIPDQKDTYITFEPDIPYIVGVDGYESKCGWSPFDGWEIYGKVQSVKYKGKIIVQEGKMLV